MGNVGKGLILRLVVFGYLGGSNYLNSFGLIHGWIFTNKNNQNYRENRDNAHCKSLNNSQLFNLFGFS